jgi:CrcB protein
MSRAPAVPQIPAPSRAHAVALVFAGGAVGTGLRATIEDTFSGSGAGLPWATFAINVSGAALLGLLIQTLALREHRSTRAGTLRLALGTGLLGGYTTYSTFVLESVRLGSDRRIADALLYDAGSLVLGFLAALTAMAAVRWLDRRRAQPPDGAGR